MICDAKIDFCLQIVSFLLSSGRGLRIFSLSPLVLFSYFGLKVKVC